MEKIIYVQFKEKMSISRRCVRMLSLVLDNPDLCFDDYKDGSKGFWVSECNIDMELKDFGDGELIIIVNNVSCSTVCNITFESESIIDIDDINRILRRTISDKQYIYIEDNLYELSYIC